MLYQRCIVVYCKITYQNWEYALSVLKLRVVESDKSKIVFIMRSCTYSTNNLFKICVAIPIT